MQKYQFRNDFTWQAGSHGLKFGANYIYTKLGGYFYFGASGYTVAWFDDPLTIANNRARYPAGLRNTRARCGNSSSPRGRPATSRTSTRSPSTRRTTGGSPPS